MIFSIIEPVTFIDEPLSNMHHQLSLQFSLFLLFVTLRSASLQIYWLISSPRLGYSSFSCCVAVSLGVHGFLYIIKVSLALFFTSYPHSLRWIKTSKQAYVRTFMKDKLIFVWGFLSFKRIISQARANLFHFSGDNIYMASQRLLIRERTCPVSMPFQCHSVSIYLQSHCKRPGRMNCSSI